MRIAVIAPLEEAVPPKKYGGTERIVYEIAHGMGQAGHTVDLYASGDSKQEPQYTLYPTVSKHLRATAEYKENADMRSMRKLLAMSHIVEQLKSKKYDLIHNNFAWRYLLFSHFVNAPVLTTHHDPLTEPEHNMIYLEHKDAYHVSISNNQRKDLPKLHYVDTVYNGVDPDELPFCDNPAGDYMFFLARICPQKGTLPAIHAAMQTKKKLILASKIDIREKEFFEKEVTPFLDNKIVTFEGEVGGTEKIKLLQNARCLLVPIQWEEPFGLMFTEAMSCGTPVITFARGAAPEIVVDGSTGFLVNESEKDKRGNFIVKKTGVAGLVEAIERLYSLPDQQYRQMRFDCRKRVVTKFTLQHMVDGYLSVYQKVFEEEKKRNERHQPRPSLLTLTNLFKK